MTFSDCATGRAGASYAASNLTDASLTIAVLVPCYQEAASIAAVVKGFCAALPDAQIYVYDNNSTDGTADIAAAAGALVRQEPLQGKGHVVRRMFADVEADLYILVDGDATYDAASAPRMVARLLDDGLDMLTAVRVTQEVAAYRRGHKFGNRLLTGIVQYIFNRPIADMLSGYRVLSRRFVKSFPAASGGFETETELTVHALELRMPIGEIATPYFARPEGSHSKLATYKDGARILTMVVHLIREERPFLFFSALAALLAGASLIAGAPVVIDFIETGLVPRLPSAVLAAAFGILSFLAFTSGVILDSVARSRREARRFAYLRLVGPHAAAQRAARAEASAPGKTLAAAETARG